MATTINTAITGMTGQEVLDTFNGNDEALKVTADGAETKNTTQDIRLDALEGAVVVNEGNITINSNNIDTLGIDAVFQDDRLDVLESPSVTPYTPQLTRPLYVEGNVYYNDVSGTLDVQGEYPDVTLQVGREQHFEVINNSGALILNGKPVRNNGVAGGEVQIELAIADNFTNATLLGVTTHDIPHGSKGIITTFGVVGDIDTSGLPQGVPIYLSDTIPGGLTDIAPDIASQIGGVIVVDALIGKIFIKIDSNVNLPNAVALLHGQTLGNETYSISGVAQVVNNYNAGGNIILPEDILNGTITPTIDGFYRVSLNSSISFSSTASTRTLFVDLYNKTDATVLDTFATNIPRDATADSVSFSPMVELVATKEYQLNIWSDVAFDITFDSITFDLESIHIRL